MSKKLYSLTEEHRAQLKPWADKWIANALSTKPMDDDDRAAMRKAIVGQYAAADLAAPIVVFSPSPFVTRVASGFAAWIWYCRENKGVADLSKAMMMPDYKGNKFSDPDSVAGRIEREVWRCVKQATTKQPDPKHDSRTAREWEASYSRIPDCADPGWADKWFHFPDIMALAELCGLGEAGAKCAYLAYRMWRGNNQWSGWTAFLSFFRHIVKLPLDYSKWEHYEKACIHGGPMCMHPKFCIVSDRPRVLKTDERNLPHCVDGPFCEWSDGTALFSVHNVRVPRSVVMHPEAITVSRIESEPNAEIRRVLTERYGLARYLTDSGAQEIGRDDFGVLYRKEQPGDEPIVMVKVVNSTAEPDGSFKDYFIRVDPELRPLLEDGRKGDPQPMTARNAVASTFGLKGEEYEPAIET